VRGGASLVLLGPFALLGAVAGTLYLLSRRPGLPAQTRRLLGALWVLVLLAGGPLWLLLWAALSP
jgi:hypothetical protein